MNSRLVTGLLLFFSCAPAFARSSNSGGSAFLILGLIGVGILYWIFRSMVNSRVKKEVNRTLSQRQSEIDAKEFKERSLTAQRAEEERQRTAVQFKNQQSDLAKERERTSAQLKQQKDDLARADAAFKASYTQGRAWLANFIAEAFRAPDEATARSLETKKHPAQKAADDVRRIAAEKRDLLRQLKLFEYTIKTYHEYYPALEQYSEDILNETATLALGGDDADPNVDFVSHYISKEEYEKLKPTERNQKALDNWKARRKSNVEIGRMYERYLGHRYETDGWTVTYFGATQGLEDLGRDLICLRGNALHVVQAKYWAKHKTIHEKHIFQLYGTTIMLPLTKPDFRGTRVTPVFAATTALSETAAWAARELKVEVRNLDMDHDYPMIKCNVNAGNKIYHLPFDQQYDRVRIDPTRDERYVKTTAEAEKLGFRRAMRHTAYSK